MADFADLASDRTEQNIQALLSQRPRFTGTSATHCTECDDPIPEQRRAALPGVGLCVDCQQIKEARKQ